MESGALAVALLAVSSVSSGATRDQIERACQRTEANATFRLIRQIRNFKFAYDLQLNLTDHGGRPLDPAGFARARGNLLEACRWSENTWQQAGRMSQ